MLDTREVFHYRQRQVAAITSEIGVYALCDLDEVPIYVGQSIDGIRARVRRHLTSARSDIIANRQIDVWEIAYVWAWPIEASRIKPLESRLFHDYHVKSALMNGSIPMDPGLLDFTIPEPQRVQVMPDPEIATRRDPRYRLPRQIEHIGRLVDHILNVKDSPELRASLVAHFNRLGRYYDRFLEPTPEELASIITDDLVEPEDNGTDAAE